MRNRIRTLFFGKPLKDSDLEGERLSVLWGVPVFSSDTISTVTYAGEEILLVLIPLLGLAAYRVFLWIAAALMALLLVLVLGYRQTIGAYPQGGGAYTVALDNLGERPGVVAGASLVVEYVLIVAVSASTAAAAVVSAFPAAAGAKSGIALLLILLLAWLHLRGMHAAAIAVGIPTYCFVALMLFLIVRGFLLWDGNAVGIPSRDITLIGAGPFRALALDAFASGCTALAGIEAVSNGVSHFREPAEKNAKRVLLSMGLIVAAIFLGISVLSGVYRIVPTNLDTMLSQLAGVIFGRGSVWYLLVQIMTVVILSLAANTAFVDLPHLMAMMAEDHYLPRRLIYRGSRLNYSNGIALLFSTSALLTLIFRANQHKLLPLFASGVFISFFLNQLGMLRYWSRKRGKARLWHGLVNLIALLATSLTLVVLIGTRFASGAWVTLLSIALLTELMLGIRRHYVKVHEELAIRDLEEARALLEASRTSRAILPARSFDRAFLKAYNCAQDLGFSEIEVYYVGGSAEKALAFQSKLEALSLKCRYVYEITEYRNAEDILVKHIEQASRRLAPHEHLTVLIPNLVMVNPLKQPLHNETSRVLMQRLSRYHAVSIFQVPYLFQ